MSTPETVPFFIDTPLDERSRRRPDFAAGGIPVKLDDGNEWFFPRPLMEIRPDFTGGPPASTTWGKEFDDLLENQGETLMQLAQRWFRIARFMLLKNYVLDDRDFQILLAYRVQDEENMAAWRTIQAVAYGGDASPKA